MTSYLDVIPLYPEKTLANILADMDAVAMEDTDPENAVDTRPGSLYYLATRPLARGLAAAWDSLSTEVVAAANIGTSWGAYLDLHADSFQVIRKDAAYASGTETFVGEPGTLLPVGIQVGLLQTDPDVEPPTFATTDSGTIPAGGVLTLPIEAQLPGSDGNVAAGAITQLLTPVVSPNGTPITSVTNDEMTAGGSDTETDDELRTRLQLEFAGKGSGTQTDYRRWALAYPGVGRVEVVPVWSGPGTVQVIISGADGSPVGPETIDGLQAVLDPVAGQGKGLAPIGHTVTVATIALAPITVSATVALDSGFTLTGTTGGVGVQDEITDALASYINTLAPGEDVVYEHVKSTFFEVDGVHDISNVTVNGGTANIVITTNPPQVARLTTVTLA